MSNVPPPIRVNRAPVLTPWAATVAEALGHPEDTALTLSAGQGTAAWDRRGTRRRREAGSLGANGEADGSTARP